MRSVVSKYSKFVGDEYKTFHIGINVFVIKSGHLLLGKRKNVFGAGTWGLPGGHLEPGESMSGAAARELMEETGLSTKKFEFSNLVNDRTGGQHRMQIGFLAGDVDDDPLLREPDRCEEWKWFKLKELPEELFPPHVAQIKIFLQNIYFAEA